ncbi:hypothetical protein D3C75_685350 [compost metagenome]
MCLCNLCSMNAPGKEADKRRAQEQTQESSGGSLMTGMIAFAVLAVVVIAVFYVLIIGRIKAEQAVQSCLLIL